MQIEKFKEEVRQIIGNQVLFDGHFDKCYENLKNSQKNELLIWVKDCLNKNINPIISKRDKEIIGFVKRFGSNIRSILTKRKEGYFISIFLDKHKYYETEMEKLGF